MALDLETSFRIRRRTFEGLRPTYDIYDSRGDNVLCAQRNGLGMREPTHLFRVGPSKETYLRLEPRPDINQCRAFSVLSTSGQAPIAIFCHSGVRSFTRDSWKILDPSERERASIQEPNTGLAIARRILRSIPHRYDARTADGEVLWRFDRTFSFALSKMTVRLIAERKDVDRRLALAAGVLLCAQEEDDER